MPHIEAHVKKPLMCCVVRVMSEGWVLFLLLVGGVSLTNRKRGWVWSPPHQSFNVMCSKFTNWETDVVDC